MFVLHLKVCVNFLYFFRSVCDLQCLSVFRVIVALSIITFGNRNATTARSTSFGIPAADGRCQLCATKVGNTQSQLRIGAAGTRPGSRSDCRAAVRGKDAETAGHHRRPADTSGECCGCRFFSLNNLTVCWVRGPISRCWIVSTASKRISKQSSLCMKSRSRTPALQRRRQEQRRSRRMRAFVHPQRR